MDNNAAFYYLSDGYDTGGKALMGRQVAGAEFLKGFMKHAHVKRFYCYSSDVRHFSHFKKTVIGTFGDEKCEFIPFDEHRRLGEVGCLFFPGPVIGPNAWLRRNLHERAYSICGVTHTTATAAVMDSIGSLLINPIQQWDAVVCTSTVVKKTFERVISAYADYLKERTGLYLKASLQLPVIPLGVDCRQFFPRDGASYRAYWREKLGLTADDVVVLYVGRFCFNAKVHPLSMFAALEEAARRSTKSICLILAGWFDPPAVEKLWKEDIGKFCPSLKKVFIVDGRQEQVRREIWSVADIFTSLSDNIQETFGLTPIEAMAAGLPVVVTDWDGYRDTVRHGIDGFRVPVFMPEPGLGEEIAQRFASGMDSYEKYCGIVSQVTSVDIRFCAHAYLQLVENDNLRKQMGEEARKRALEHYDWSRIVVRYQELWEELAKIRGENPMDTFDKPMTSKMPLRMDPFTLFAEYPTGYISDQSIIALRVRSTSGWMKHVASSPMNNFIFSSASSLILTIEEILVIIEYVEKKGETQAGDIINLFSFEKKNIVLRTIGWMGKMGILHICSPNTALSGI